MIGSPFEVIEPQTGESPVVVEVPHAGLQLDPESLAYTIAPARSIARDADLYVNELFQDAPNEGATFVCAQMSRYVIDLNRGEDDVDQEAVEGGGRTPWPRGLIWRLTTDGDSVLIRRLPRAELDRRLDAFYRPYHRELTAILARKRAKFGFVVLLCAHSMPSLARRGHNDSPGQRADIVPGTRGRTTAAPAVIDLVDWHARSFGFSVRHDDPYRGGFSTGFYGKPTHNAHAIQVEISRRLYMDETNHRRDAQGFRVVREFARSLVSQLAFSESPTTKDALRTHASAGR
ncbi:MAG TPA: N-formylglutamate amidohydrolase [Polyangium sp.]|nr:N-formylglutamate amidohydrolase [Polyangium sp.]